jgi:glutamate-5-semialdehyde dehydrogenase
MNTIENQIIDIARNAKSSARIIASLSTEIKNQLLLKMAEALIEKKDYIQKENQKDLDSGSQKGLSSAMLDRLALSDKVMDSMVSGINEVAALPDPIGEISDMNRMPSGITVGRMRIPLGVIGMIYESRPNVTVDAAALCLKAGNAIILRGGSEAIHSNLALAQVLQDTLTEFKLDPAIIQVIPTTDRQAVNNMLAQEEYIDLIIPRGGEGLIRFVAENSRIPVLKHYKGVCHLYVDQDADLQKAVDIVMNGKVQRPGVCNALETMLVNENIAAQFLPLAAKALMDAGVELRGCPETCKIIARANQAEESDWGAEFLELILAVRVVKDLDAAMDHIVQYGSQHTEVIVTSNYDRAMRFIREVDASSVMINASSRFSDGGQFGLGAEIGISTTKLHAYGPMGLKELTTKKFIVHGDGQIRQ